MTAPTSRLRRGLLYGALGFYALLVIYPMAWLFATSFKDSWSIFKDPWSLPDTLQWKNYISAWTAGELGGKFWNSLVIDTTALVLILGLSSMTAYALGRFRFFGDRVLSYLFLTGMALPVFLGVIPLFRLMNQIGLLDNRAGLLIAYVAFSLSFTIFVLTGFFRTMPGELAEAAAIDGCPPFATFWRIMLPLAKPGLTAAGIFVFIGLWNEYPLALVLITSDNLETLPLGIANLTMTQRYQSDWGALFAALTISVLPTIVVYSLFQRQIQEGLTAGALK